MSASPRTLFACGGAGLAFHTVVHQVLGWRLKAEVGPPPRAGYDREWSEAMMPKIFAMFWTQLAFDVAFLVVLGVVAWKKPSLRLGVLAAFIAIVCAFPGIGALYFVFWNIPFWLAVSAAMLHLTKRLSARNVLLALAGIAVLGLLVGHFTITSLN